MTYLLLLCQAIGARNKLKSIAKHRESQKQQLHSLIAEKKMELERYQYNNYYDNNNTLSTMSYNFVYITLHYN